MRVAFALLAFLALGGCAGLPPAAPRAASADGVVARCERLYAALDDAVAAAGVSDGGEARVPGFPYLRADRLLASYRTMPLDDAALRDWVDALMELDRAARGAELENMPRAARPEVAARLAADGWPRTEPAVLLEGCSRALRDHDLADPSTVARLRAAVGVPDDYATWQRVVGLYAFTSMPFAYGVSRYEAEVRATYRAPLEQLPVRGTLVRYAPRASVTLTAAEVAVILTRSSANPLGIPRPAREDFARLAAAFAPVLEIDEADRNDRIGSPTWGSGGPGIDGARPVAFVRAAHARVGDRVLLQIVYSFWFPARPRTWALDLLGGEIDGITWRVTLASDGHPVVFDTMHNCGCYHMFFPTERATVRSQPYTIEEQALVPQRLPALAPSDRVALRIASRTHYLERVVVVGRGAAPAERGYTIDGYDALRSLPLADGDRRSFFRPDGIVPGSERGERWLFWPMGVPEPGAMRQWGRHATAFVGRRHFDDPFLIERYFELR